MSGEIALDTSVAVRFLNGDPEVVTRVLALPEIYLSSIVAGELLFGAENSTRALKKKGRPIPMNDVWIAAHCLERGWVLVTDDLDFDYVDDLVI